MCSFEARGRGVSEKLMQNAAPICQQYKVVRKDSRLIISNQILNVLAELFSQIRVASLRCPFDFVRSSTAYIITFRFRMTISKITKILGMISIRML